MMNRWNPIRELEDFVQNYQRMMSPAKMQGLVNEPGKEAMAHAEWMPAVDISETAQSYLVKAEIPDVKKEDIKLNVHEHVLRLTGERRLEKQENGPKHHRIERIYGSFARSFALPEDADETRVAAEYRDGVLHVTIPKMERAQPRAIDVQIGG